MSRGKCIVYIHSFANIATYHYNRSMDAPQKPATTETIPEAPKTVIKQSENSPITENNKGLAAKSPASMDQPSKELVYIKNKRGYAAFKRYVAKGKYTSAQAAAIACGVDPSTIRTWLQTKSVIDVMSAEVDAYIDKIASAQDWKAQQYLLERVSPTIKEEKSFNTAIQIVLPSLQDTQGQILAL